MRIDSHTHLIPDDYRDVITSRGLVPYELAPWSLDLMHDFMADYEIDAAVLSLSPPGVFFGDQGLATDLARMVNERTAAMVDADPDRFAGLGVLPLPDVDAALAEIAYALDVLKLDGIALFSNVDGSYLGDERWAPVFDELDRRGAYVFLHPTAPPGPPALAQYPEWLYELPFDTTRAVVDLIYSGTLERCAALRLQVSHLGGTALVLAARIGSLASRAPDLATKAPAGALSYLSSLYYDTGLSNEAALVRGAMTTVPLERIVFGTDWPYAALPEPGDPAPSLSALGSDRKALEHTNIGALIPRWRFDPHAGPIAAPAEPEIDRSLRHQQQSPSSG